MFDLARFQKIIRNRVVWIIFLILIIASFVFSFSPNVDQSVLLGGADRLDATVNGREIRAEEYQRNVFYAEKSRFEDRSGAEQGNRALRRIALLDLAAKAGVRVSDQELQDMVGKADIFKNQQGQFEPRAFVGYLIQEKWPSETTFFDFQRQEGVLYKLFELAAGGAQVVSPADIREAYERDYARYEIEYARLEKAAAVTNEIPVTEAMVQAYYDENKDSYSRPEEVKVRYMTISVSDAFDTGSVTDAEAQAYYTEKLATEFTKMVPSTNALAGVTNTTASLETKVLPFEQVRVGIQAKLAFGKAMEQIKQTAYKYYDDMLPRRDHETQTFDQIAGSFGIPNATSEYFTVGQPLPGIDVGLQFNQLAFSLGNTEFDRVGEPLVSSNKVYLVQLLDRRAPRIQELSEVADRVRLAAAQKAKTDALLEKAKEARAKIAEALKAGQAFSNAVASVGLVPTNAPPFTRAGGEIQQTPGLFQVLNQLDDAAVGDLLDPVMTADAALLVRIKSIASADPAGFEEKRRLYVGGIAQRRYMAMVKAFREEAAKAIKEKPAPRQEPAPESPAKAG